MACNGLAISALHIGRKGSRQRGSALVQGWKGGGWNFRLRIVLTIPIR